MAHRAWRAAITAGRPTEPVFDHAPWLGPRGAVGLSLPFPLLALAVVAGVIALLWAVISG